LVGNKSVGRIGHMSEDNIKIHSAEIGYGLDSAGSEQRQVMGCFEHGNNIFWVSWKAVNFTRGRTVVSH
jgi:hypothetical protein